MGGAHPGSDVTVVDKGKLHQPRPLIPHQLLNLLPFRFAFDIEDSVAAAVTPATAASTAQCISATITKTAAAAAAFAFVSVTAIAIAVAVAVAISVAVPPHQMQKRAGLGPFRRRERLLVAAGD